MKKQRKDLNSSFPPPHTTLKHFTPISLGISFIFPKRCYLSFVLFLLKSYIWNWNVILKTFLFKLFPLLEKTVFFFPQHVCNFILIYLIVLTAELLLLCPQVRPSLTLSMLGSHFSHIFTILVEFFPFHFKAFLLLFSF